MGALLTSWFGEELVKILVQSFLGWIGQLERDQQNQQKGRTDAQIQATASEAVLEAQADKTRADAAAPPAPGVVLDHAHWRD